MFSHSLFGTRQTQEMARRADNPGYQSEDMDSEYDDESFHQIENRGWLSPRNRENQQYYQRARQTQESFYGSDDEPRTSDVGFSAHHQRKRNNSPSLANPSLKRHKNGPASGIMLTVNDTLRNWPTRETVNNTSAQNRLLSERAYGSPDLPLRRFIVEQSCHDPSTKGQSTQGQSAYSPEIGQSPPGRQLRSPYQYAQSRAPFSTRVKEESCDTPQNTRNGAYGHSTNHVAQPTSYQQNGRGNHTPWMYDDDEFNSMPPKTGSAPRGRCRYPVIQENIQRGNRGNQAVIDIRTPQTPYERRGIAPPTRFQAQAEMNLSGSEGSDLEFEEALEEQADGWYRNESGRESIKSRAIVKSPRQRVTPINIARYESYRQQPPPSGRSQNLRSLSPEEYPAKLSFGANGVVANSNPATHYSSDDETLENLIRLAATNERSTNHSVAKTKLPSKESPKSHIGINSRLNREDKVIEERQYVHENSGQGQGHTPRGFTTDSPRKPNVLQTPGIKSLRNPNLLNIRTPSVNGDVSNQFYTPKEWNSEKYNSSLVARAREREELRRQDVTIDRIFQQERQAEELREHDDMLEETSADEEAKAGFRRPFQHDLKNKYVREDAKIVIEPQKRMCDEQASKQNEREAVETERRKAEQKRKILEEEKEKARMKEEERLAAKRKIATEKLERDRRERLARQMQSQDEMRKDKASTDRVSTAETGAKIASSASVALEIAPAVKYVLTQRSTDNSSHHAIVTNDVPRFVELPELLSPIIGMEMSTPEVDSSEEQGAVVESETNLLDVATDFQKSLSQKTSDENSEPVGTAEVAKIQVITNDADSLSLAKPADNENAQVVPDDDKETSTTEETQQPQVEISNAEKTFLDLAASEQESPISTAQEAQFAAAAIKEKPEPLVANNQSIQDGKKSSCGTSIADIAGDNRRRPPVKSKVLKNLESDRRAGVYVPKPQKGHVSGRKLESGVAVGAADPEDPEDPDGSVAVKARSLVAESLKELEKMKSDLRAEGDMQSNVMNLFVQALKGSNGKGSKTVTDLQKVLGGKHKIKTPKSKITLVSDVEAQKKQKQEAEEAKKANYQKLKQRQRGRYDRSIREAMAGQGKELDEEILKKTLEDKMNAWEENRRKRERRDSKSNDEGPVRHGSDDDGRQSSSPPTDKEDILPGTGAENEMESSASLRLHRNINQAFARAALKSRVEELDSEESEEDPDSEPEPAASMNKTGPVRANDDLEDTDENVNHDDFEAETAPPLPESPEKSQPLLPAVVNPTNTDLMHAYKVRHRTERGDTDYDSIVLGSFHSLSEANTFAQQKLAALELGPSTGKSETHDANNLYCGRAITDKELEHAEIIWVSREILFIGDVANLKRGDLKHIVHSKVFNVVQVLFDDDAGHTQNYRRNSSHSHSKPQCKVTTTTSIKALANKKAADLFLALSKPTRPRLDWLDRYERKVAPAVREKLDMADANDWIVDLGEGFNEETEKTFTVSVWENDVVGPMN